MSIWHNEVWSGIQSVVDTPQIRLLLSKWGEVPVGGSGLPGLPDFQLVAQELNSDLGQSLMVLDEQADDFVYVHYGAAIARHAEHNMLGRRVSDFGGELGDLFLRLYRAVRERRCPLYATHFSDSGRTAFVWERLILPFQLDANTLRLVVYNAPMAPRSQLLEALVGATHDALLALGPVYATDGSVRDWIVLLANRFALDVFGFENPNPTGQLLSSMPSKWSALNLEPSCQAVAQSLRPLHLELSLPTGANTQWLDCHIAPLDGGCVVRLSNVTQRKIMELAHLQQNKLLENIIANIPDGLSVFDDQLRLVASNAKFKELFAFPDELFEPSQRRFSDFARYNALKGDYGDGDPETLAEQVVERARNPKPHQFERQRPDGTMLSVRGVPMTDGGFVTTYTDITARRRAEAAVLLNEDRLQRALTASRLSFWDYSVATDALYLSDKWSEFLGGPCTPTHTTFTALGDRIPPEDQSIIVKAMSRVLEGQDASYAVEHRVIRLDGTIAWIRSEGQIVEFNDNGEPVRALGTNRDITQRMHAELAKSATTGVLNAVLSAAKTICIIATDSQRVVTVFNEGAELLLGHSARDVIGTVGWSMFHDESELSERANVIAAALGRPMSLDDAFLHDSTIDLEREWTYVRKNRSKVRVAITLTAMRSPTHAFLGYLAVGRDVSVQKAHETSLTEAIRAAEQSATAKAAFLAAMSHEIRTPMNGVIGMTHLLIESDLSDEQREHAEIIRVSGENLMVVINDILDFSKIESGHMTIQTAPMSVRQVVESGMQVLRLSAHNKGLTLALTVQPLVPPWIVGDAARIRQVLLNLIGNAVKFTDLGHVSVEVGLLVNASGIDPMIEFSVKDSGIGIAASDIEKLFQSFMQLDASASRRHGGTGLGLVISKRLALAMGGNLSVQSAPGTGSRFSLTLPLHTAAGPSIDANTKKSQSRVKVLSNLSDRLPMRILLAEDNLINQKLALRMLLGFGYRADVANNGREALDMLHRQPYDLVFMDVQMPEMDGLSAARIVAGEWPDASRPVVVAMSANALPEDIAAATAAGMQDYITKPVELVVLRTVLEKWGEAIVSRAPLSSHHR